MKKVMVLVIVIMAMLSLVALTGCSAKEPTVENTRHINAVDYYAIINPIDEIIVIHEKGDEIGEATAYYTDGDLNLIGTLGAQKDLRKDGCKVTWNFKDETPEDMLNSLWDGLITWKTVDGDI